MRTVPVIQVVASVVIGLFLLRIAQRLTDNTSNPIGQGLNGGLHFLIG